MTATQNTTTFSATYDDGYAEATAKAKHLTNDALHSLFTRAAQSMKQDPKRNGYATGLVVAYGNEIDRRTRAQK